jgi:uncharacterized RDD family membrane protein YckC
MASADYQVLTPERVTLQYDIAGLGSRGAAALVDTAIQTAILGVVFAAALGGLALLGGGGGRGLVFLVGALMLLALALVTLGYFIVFEIVWNGQTPGKRLVGVRVIRESGYPIRPADAVVRNLVRIVDGLPALYAAGVVTMLLNGRSKRLGDFAAGTLVVREGTRAPLGRLPFAASTAPPVPFAAPVTSSVPVRPGLALAPNDATLVRDFLIRRPTMRPGARAALARRLAEAIARRYGLGLDADPSADPSANPSADPSADPEAFLEQLSL